MDKTVNIKVETEGMEEVTQQAQALADSFDAFPSQVTFKYLKNCTINVYPSQTKIVEVKEANHQQEYEDHQQEYENSQHDQ